jgi:hypothetical protein
LIVDGQGRGWLKLLYPCWLTPMAALVRYQTTSKSGLRNSADGQGNILTVY